MKITFDRPKQNDLETIMKIEHSGFTVEEAATEQAMSQRIDQLQDSFIVARNTETNEVIGYIVGPVSEARYISDELFEETTPNKEAAQYQTVLSLVVAPSYREKGIGGALLNELKKSSQKRGLKGITLTCLENLLSFYEQYGYVNEGISDSVHAGQTWYNMVLELDSD